MPPIKYTSIIVKIAPIKAHTPIVPIPKTLTCTPKRIAIVAPSAAPEDIPKICGSASGF